MTARGETRRWLVGALANPTNECLDWPFSRDAKGYGRVWNGLATHAALTLDGRPRPPGAFALHSCDRPCCVNPGHLRWGTNSENVAEMVARRRHVHGAATCTAKLTDEDVAAIRRAAAQGAKQRSLAERFGVNQSQISRIVNRRRWGAS